ncbi:MAG: Gfo/Idh/MocA family oxidoreductase [Phycisphaeraceae bacterium]|nr:MAG: Gfo/Idh/MocA family oxidoreductase [Phycisphaeraceae bacterium]
MRIGVVGCGNISGQYFRTLARFANVTVAAVCDRDGARARAAAEKWGVPRVLTLDKLLDDPEIDAVLNLTTPDAHHEVALRAIAAGKHVYNEKPITSTLDEARDLLAAAGDRGLRIGCAPDTVLGSTWQTVRALIDRGELGVVVGGQLTMVYAGPEWWHPDPEFYYKPGAGPVLDMGPYFIHALVMLLGPVARVTARTRRTHARRRINSEPKRGEMVDVEVDTHATAILELESGPIVTMLMSFDVPASRNRDIEIYGSAATLAVHSPNDFEPAAGGLGIELRRVDGQAWEPVDLTGGPAVNGRGLGIAEMASAIAEDRPHRASGELALHALEVMLAVGQSSEEGRSIDIVSRPPRPEPLPDGWRPGSM